jgi:uncharacterized protein YchJ
MRENYQHIGKIVTGQKIDGTETSVQVFRDMRRKNHYDEQTKLYSPCSCGSGKKNKFCCKGKQMIKIDTGS